jgi:hypothetical protein
MGFAGDSWSALLLQAVLRTTIRQDVKVSWALLEVRLGSIVVIPREHWVRLGQFVPCVSRRFGQVGGDVQPSAPSVAALMTEYRLIVRGQQRDADLQGQPEPGAEPLGWVGRVSHGVWQPGPQ